jgi:hypothetical protein
LFLALFIVDTAENPYLVLDRNENEILSISVLNLQIMILVTARYVSAQRKDGRKELLCGVLELITHAGLLILCTSLTPTPF